MRRCGRLVKLWRMRFEAKHQESKITVNVSFCKKNRLYTLALKHQLELSNYLLSDEGFSPRLIMGRKKLISISDLRLSQDTFVPNSLHTSFFDVNWINKSGIIYKKNLCIVTGQNEGFS